MPKAPSSMQYSGSWDCGNKWGPPKWEGVNYIFRAWYRKGIGHHHLLLADTQRQAEGWEGIIMNKREASGALWSEVFGMRKLGASSLEIWQPVWLVWGVYWLSLVNSKLEIVAKIKKSESYFLCLGSLGPIATAVMSQSSVFTCGLAVVLLSILSLRTQVQVTPKPVRFYHPYALPRMQLVL